MRRLPAARNCRTPLPLDQKGQGVRRELGGHSCTQRHPTKARKNSLLCCCHPPTQQPSGRGAQGMQPSGLTLLRQDRPRGGEGILGVGGLGSITSTASVRLGVFVL